MAKTFRLVIAKVGETVFDGEAVSVSLPGKEGVFTVLAGHEAFVSELQPGEARIEVEGKEGITVPLTGGVAEVSGGQATVLL